MKLVQRYLMKLFLPVFLVALLFFVLLLQLGDLVANIVYFLQNEAPAKDIIKVMLLYIPKCISYSVPLAILFAGSYTMGSLYANNELTSVFSAGISLGRFTLPLLFFGLLLSFGMIFFEDSIVIKYFYQKNKLVNKLLDSELDLNSYDVVILSEFGKVVYIANYYDDNEKSLSKPTIVVRDNGRLSAVLESPRAKWDGEKWQFDKPSIYLYQENNKIIWVDKLPKGIVLNEPPQSFQRNLNSVDEMTIKDAKLFISEIKKKGLPYYEELSKYYRRFSFPFTIFIVLFFSISLGGKFKKNILLMSILFSLGIATLFYITEMLTMMAAKWEYISPLAGAWVPIFVFSILSLFLLKKART